MQTKESLAARLSGREYRAEMSAGDENEAKESGLVVVFGASDDLMEFRGAIDDEIGANEGTTARVTALGLLPEWDPDTHHDEDNAEAYFVKKRAGFREIEAVWCGEPGYSWTFKTTIPHATFEIVEDGEPYCRGIVFAMADISTAQV